MHKYHNQLTKLSHAPKVVRPMHAKCVKCPEKDMIMASEIFNVTTTWTAIQLDGSDITDGTFEIFNRQTKRIDLKISSVQPAQNEDAPDFLRQSTDLLRFDIPSGDKLYCKIGGGSATIGVRSVLVPQDYNEQVSLGKVAGVRNVFMSSESSDIGSDDTEVTPLPGDYDFNYSGTPEQWEILSTSNDDKPGGNGIAGILLTYIQTDFSETSVVVELNGTSVVVIPGVNKISPQKIIAATVTNGGAAAAGDITLRKIGDTGDRGIIMADDNESNDGIMMVPAGKTWILRSFIGSPTKGADIDFTFETTTGQDGIFVSRPPLATYQNITAFSVTSLPIIEKSFVRVRATSSNNNTEGSVFLFFRETTN